MAVRCLGCGYVMKTNQEFQSAVLKAGWDLLDFVKEIPAWLVTVILSKIPVAMPQGYMAGQMNFGERAIPCPKCGEKGRWEDV